MGFYKWSPSKTAKREFAKKMAEIDEFCKKNNISQSSSGDSYYFTIGDKNYRVSNHSPESSYHRDSSGSLVAYHCPDFRETTICIHASKTRIIEIYNDLKAGYDLDGHGNRKK